MKHRATNISEGFLNWQVGGEYPHSRPLQHQPLDWWRE
jgi:hypothetical protein